ncbi:MAG: sulfur carrier protein ThiS [Nitrospirae bacterium]|nr:sulfur carrier protein ThiS [Nitrospirota bacterium]
MIIKLNGENYEIPYICSIEELLIKLNIAKNGVAVEVNLNIIKKISYNTFMLNEGDSVEIVNFVGGG